jgi:hypothetical protein
MLAPRRLWGGRAPVIPPCTFTPPRTSAARSPPARGRSSACPPPRARARVCRAPLEGATTRRACPFLASPSAGCPSVPWCSFAPHEPRGPLAVQPGWKRSPRCAGHRSRSGRTFSRRTCGNPYHSCFGDGGRRDRNAAETRDRFHHGHERALHCRARGPLMRIARALSVWCAPPR